MNRLFEAIKAKNDQADIKYKYVVLLDEVEIFDDNYDFTNLNVNYDFIDIIVAFNPFSRHCYKKYDIKLPHGSKCLVERLRCKHRHSTEISFFILHYTKYHNSSDRGNLDQQYFLP